MESLWSRDVLDRPKNVGHPTWHNDQSYTNHMFYRYARIHRLGIRNLQIDDYLMLLVAVSFDLQLLRQPYTRGLDMLTMGIGITGLVYNAHNMSQCHRWRRWK